MNTEVVDWAGIEPAISALRRRHSTRLNYQPLLPFESRIIFNVMESVVRKEKQFLRF
jgi:hypothetical protein